VRYNTAGTARCDGYTVRPLRCVSVTPTSEAPACSRRTQKRPQVSWVTDNKPHRVIIPSYLRECVGTQEDVSRPRRPSDDVTDRRRRRPAAGSSLCHAEQAVVRARLKKHGIRCHRMPLVIQSVERLFSSHTRAGVTRASGRCTYAALAVRRGRAPASADCPGGRTGRCVPTCTGRRETRSRDAPTLVRAAAER
jgi:hypothetical protein